MVKMLKKLKDVYKLINKMLEKLKIIFFEL